jgi:hypothetical protein
VPKDEESFHANQLSITIFVAALTALMAGRGFILAMLKTSSKAPESLPSATLWLAVVRNILLVAAAIYSKYLNDYTAQWVIAFAAIAMAATGVAGLVLAIIRRDVQSDITSRFLDACAGVLAIVFTQSIHGWDPQFISTLVSSPLSRRSSRGPSPRPSARTSRDAYEADTGAQPGIGGLEFTPQTSPGPYAQDRPDHG